MRMAQKQTKLSRCDEAASGSTPGQQLMSMQQFLTEQSSKIQRTRKLPRKSMLSKSNSPIIRKVAQLVPQAAGLGGSCEQDAESPRLQGNGHRAEAERQRENGVASVNEMAEASL